MESPVRPTAWVSLATGATLVCSAASLEDLVAAPVWLAPLLTGVLTAWLILTLIRARYAGRILPSICALVAMTGVVTAWFAAQEAFAGFVPTRRAIDYLYHLFLLGIERLQLGSPPIEHSPAAGLVVTSTLLVAYLLADLVAVDARAPVWALVPALGVWAAPITLGEEISLLWVAGTGVGAAAMIAASSYATGRIPAQGRLRSAVTLTAATAVTVAVALVLAPALLLLPTPVHWRASQPGDATNLDLGLNLRDDLRRPEPRVVITYDGIQPADLGPLHAYTLTTFDGSSWHHTDADQWQPAEDDYLWPGAFESRAQHSVTVRIHDLQQDRLPVPGEPREVHSEEPLAYAARTDEVRLVDPVSGTFSYELSIRPRDLSPARLADLDPRDAATRPALLQVPDTGYSQRIADLTRKVVSQADADTAYEQLVAIQNYLRDPGIFSYTESVASGDTDDAVWDFLQDRRGYCVQFATTMVIMARTLDLPSRLAIGYLPGEPTDDGTVQITSDQAHAWPQVLFPEVGWVRFEPTPGVQSGQAPSWAPAGTQGSDPSAPSSASTPTAAATETEESTPDSAETDSEQTATAAGPSARLSWWLPALIALALVATAAWGRLRRRGSQELEGTWHRAEALIRAAGGTVGTGATPRAAVRSAAGVFESQHAYAALAELARAVELDRYADGAETPSAHQIRQWISDIARDPAVPPVQRWAARVRR